MKRGHRSFKKGTFTKSLNKEAKEEKEPPTRREKGVVKIGLFSPSLVKTGFPGPKIEPLVSK